MFEEDYVMRVIKEMVRALLKLLFGIDTENPALELLQDQQKRDQVTEMTDLVDDGHINEAENRLYEVADVDCREDLKMVLIFYSYLNDLDDDFLEDHDYSRQEVKDGLADMIRRFGLEGMADVYLMDL